MKKKSKTDVLSMDVLRTRRDLEKAIKRLIKQDVTVGLGSLEHCLIMLKAMKRELREQGIDFDTLEGRIEHAKQRIAERPQWLKGV